MNKYFIILLIIFSSEVFAAAQVNLKFADAQVKQGALVDAVIRLNSETTQKIQYSQLKGQTLGESFYVYYAKPLMTKGSWDNLESEAKLIVLKIPEKNPLIHKLGDNEIEVTWSPVEFIATEAPKEMIFGQFEIPSRSQLIKWILISLGVVAFGFLAYFGFTKWQKRKALKSKRFEIKESLTTAKEYQDVVAIWQKKNSFIKEFPHLEEPFKKLEIVLFKYQFKPSQTESEKREVMNAYSIFLNSSQGGFNGI